MRISLAINFDSLLAFLLSLTQKKKKEIMKETKIFIASIEKIFCPLIMYRDEDDFEC